MLPYELIAADSATCVAITLPSAAVVEQVFPVLIDQVVRVQSIYDELDGLVIVVYTQSKRNHLSLLSDTALQRAIVAGRPERFFDRSAANSTAQLGHWNSGL